MFEQDRKLVEAAQENPERFSGLYDKYFDQIYRYVYRRVSNKTTVEDLVSQTFYDALAHLKKYEWRGYPFSSWLYKIAHNNVLKWYRSGRKSELVQLDEIRELMDHGADHREDLRRQEESDEMRNLLDKLEEEEREIIRLKFFEEASNIDIAEIMGVSANHIGVKIYRALKKMKQLLKS